METPEQTARGAMDTEERQDQQLLALLHALARSQGRSGAARELDLDLRTVGACLDAGALTRRVRKVLERKLREGSGPEAVQQRRRIDALEQQWGMAEEKLREVELGLQSMRGEHIEGMRQLERRLARLEALSLSAAPGAGAADGSAGAGAVERAPEVVAKEPAPDDAEVYGDAWPLVEEWRRLRTGHSRQGSGLSWLIAEERLLTLELAMLEEHGLTLPPETAPLRGMWRNSQINWRRAALHDVRRARARGELLRWLRRALTLGLWWR